MRRPAAPRRRAGLALAGAAAAAAQLGFPALPAAQGQAPAAEPRPVDPGRFLNFARSSASLQERASKLAATKDTRPEVREFARGMARFREEQAQRLQAVAQQRRGQDTQSPEEFEHRVVLENLEPLDHLALSRRYAEIQVQALEQEVRGYEAAASQGADDATKRFAEEALPELRRWLDGARRMQDAVKP